MGTGLDREKRRQFKFKPKPKFKADHAETEKPDFELAPHSKEKVSINRIKRKIRDSSRVLAQSERNHRIGQTEWHSRALDGFQKELKWAQENKRNKEILSRYHKVRFFERQKATRHLKKAKKRLEGSKPDTPEHAAAVKDVHIAEIDLNYTLYCPLYDKYEGIYPRRKMEDGKSVMNETGNGGEAEAALASRPPVWKTVETCMEEGTLQKLRDGKLRTSSSKAKKKSAKTYAEGPGGGVMLDAEKAEPSKPEKKDTKNTDDESDGGFFEK